MRTLTISYWTLTALGALVAVLTRADLAVGDRGPTPEWSLGGLLPPAVLLAVVALLGLVLAGSAALTGTGRRGTAVAVGGAAGLALASTVLSVELLAFLGYLPLGLVLAPFHEGMRESFLAATDLALLLQLAVLVGVVLWGITAATSLRGPTVLPTWARPEAAARWGRVAVLVAVVPPARLRPHALRVAGLPARLRPGGVGGRTGHGLAAARRVARRLRRRRCGAHRRARPAVG